MYWGLHCQQKWSVKKSSSHEVINISQKLFLLDLFEIGLSCFVLTCCLYLSNLVYKKMLKTNEWALTCILYRLTSEESQDGWAKLLQQPEYLIIFLMTHKILWTTHGNVSNKAIFLSVLVAFSTGTIEICIWKFLFSISKSKGGCRWF